MVAARICLPLMRPRAQREGNKRNSGLWPPSNCPTTSTRTQAISSSSQCVRGRLIVEFQNIRLDEAFQDDGHAPDDAKRNTDIDEKVGGQARGIAGAEPEVGKHRGPKNGREHV